jgi:hypothetical protein
MNRSSISGSALVLAIAVIGGCAATPSTSPTDAPREFWLATTGFPNACRGIGFDGTVVGDAADPRIVWLETERHGTKLLVWPPGYVARFDPDLQVIDSTGRIVFRGGDRVTGGCVKGPADDLASVVLVRVADRLEQ